MKGYKVFNPDWTCNGYQFEVGKTFTEDVTPVCCDRGFHFCTKVADCFTYYAFNPDNKVAEVEALGDIDTSDYDSKCCTNKIHIIREIAWHEVLDMVNLGKSCTGLHNSGDNNSGDKNSGDRNSGNCNRGNDNSGNRNSGDKNSGHDNRGSWNSGNKNSGHCNSGDWNKTCCSNGCFNTESPKIFLFNKPSDWTYQDWLISKARDILMDCPINTLAWVWDYDMTEEEKGKHPECSVTCGFLENEEGEAQEWWDGLTKESKDIVMSLPNFNKNIFKEITGIDMEADE